MAANERVNLAGGGARYEVGSIGGKRVGGFFARAFAIGPDALRPRAVSHFRDAVRQVIQHVQP